MVRKGMFRNRLGRTVAAAMIGAALAGAAGCKTAATPMTQGPAGDELVARIKKITYLSESNRTIVKIYASRKFEYTSYKLADPLRLAVEIPNATLDFEPRHINVDDRIMSAMSVVRFPKVNSVRLELELLSDAQFKLTQKPDYLEVMLTEGGALPAARSAASAASASAASADAGTDTESLRAENEKLRAENLEARKAALRLEEENQQLKKQVDESSKQLEEASALSRSLQARVAFMEDQLSELQTKVGSVPAPAKSDSGGITLGAPVPVPVPAPSASAALPAPITAPAESPNPADNQAVMEVDQTVAAWLKAWRNKNIDGYASFYAPEFQSQNMGLDAWVDDKRVKFSSSRKFKITADNVKIGINPDGTAKVVYEQTYKTGSYQDRGLKQLILKNDSGKWLIVSEEWSPL